jgi:acyl-CoA synthetase (AMP-forming)/AMP-acid ligase II
MVGVVKSKMPGGALMVLMPEYHPGVFLENLTRFRCTHATGVPTIYSMALRELDHMPTLDFSALRSLTVGSAPVHPELRRAMELTFGCPVEEMYGLTEGGPVVFGPALDGRPTPLGSCGKLWPACDAKLVNERGEQAAAGELLLRNPGVMTMYHNMPALTAARVKDGWLSTGDLFDVDPDGFWFFRGRIDDMFVCGGENVFPKEVEDVLLQHPDVREVCVVPLKHDTKGDAPVALVVTDAGSSLDEEQLKHFALERGPGYAHPRRVVFTQALPLNGAGKIDRNQVASYMQATVGDLASARQPS